MTRRSRQHLSAWLFLAALAGLTVWLGVLQYRWLGEVSVAERERLRESLQRSLAEVSDALNAQLTAECAALLPETVDPDPAVRQAAYIERYLAHERFFQSLSLAVPVSGVLQLYKVNPGQRRFVAAEWPSTWTAMRRHIESRAFRAGGPPPGVALSSNLVELPVFGPGRIELEWLVLEIDAEEFAAANIPTLVRRYAGATEYDISVVLTRNPETLIFGSRIPATQADASVRLFEVQFDRLFNRSGGEPRPAVPSRGAWTLLVRRTGGSLDAIVERARQRNLAIGLGILILISGAAVALVRFTGRAQNFAELQMEFVAGVSHELRTPLSVMRTAGHNLRGRISDDPVKVQKYGELIESESEKLTNIVNQILAFSNARAGRAMSTAEVLSVPALLEQALADESRVIVQAGCRVETHIDSGVPLVKGDPVTLRQVFRNLIGNAAKYAGGGGWIGVTAAEAETDGFVEIRVADRGPGIEKEDMERIFDPFYRGRSALAGQIHGTGLGLSLTKKIVEAHRGSVAVTSRPGEGAEFTVRLPSTGHYDDFANTAD